MNYSSSIIFFFLISNILSLNPLNLSNYDYPHPNKITDNEYTIALINTGDFHGYFFPKEHKDKITKELYFQGGAELLSSYINILKEEWKEKIMWLDAGDISSGGLEGRLSKGQIFIDFFNYHNLTAMALGNHEFNYDREYLYQLMRTSNFDFLVGNIYNKTINKKIFLPNQKISNIYKIGNVKIGVIGLTTVKIYYQHHYDIPELEFHEYRDIILEESAKLKSQGANAIILLGHFGLKCFNNYELYEDKEKLKIRKKNDIQCPCENNENLKNLLESLPDKTIDIFIGGHLHMNTHHWINNIACATTNGSNYFNVLYLKFKKNIKNNNFILKDVEIEGPIPICSKIYDKALHCNLIENLNDINYTLGNLTHFTFHNELIQIDSDIIQRNSYWHKLILKAKRTIGYNYYLQKRDFKQETNLLNLIVDIFRNYSKADFVLLNANNIRKNLQPGEINYLNLYQLSPFDNLLCTFEMNGDEIIKMFSDLANNKMVYMVSGLKTFYRKSDNKFIKLLIYDNDISKCKEIDKNKNYTIATYDYLIDGNMEFQKVFKWYKRRKYKCTELGTEIIYKAIKKIKYIYKDEYINISNPRINWVDE